MLPRIWLDRAPQRRILWNKSHKHYVENVEDERDQHTKMLNINILLLLWALQFLEYKGWMSVHAVGSIGLSLTLALDINVEGKTFCHREKPQKKIHTELVKYSHCFLIFFPFFKLALHIVAKNMQWYNF